MGLPAPPPMPATTTTASSSSSSNGPIPDWQRDPHGWIDYGENDDKKEHRHPSDARVFVQLCNLQQRAELNGQLGLVVGYEPSVKRYRVQLTSNNGINNNKILSLAPSNVKRAHVGQEWLGQVQILASQRHVIYTNVQAWIKEHLPPGLVAGHMGPTDAQLANLTNTVLWMAVMFVLVTFAVLVYLFHSVTKAMVAMAFGLTLGRVLGGPVLTACRRGDGSQSTLQRLQALRHGVWYNLVDFIGQVAPMPSFLSKQNNNGRPTVAWIVLVTVLWCTYVVWTLSR